MKMRKLPESELEIMIALWEADGPVPRNYFDKKLKERKNWIYRTQTRMNWFRRSNG